MTAPDTTERGRQVPVDWLGRSLGNSIERNRATNEPGGCECMKCGAIFVGAEWHDLCGMCWEEPKP